MALLASISVFIALISFLIAFINPKISQTLIVNMLSKYAFFSDPDAKITNTNKTEYILKKQLSFALLVGVIVTPLYTIMWSGFLLHRFNIHLNFLIYILFSLISGLLVWYGVGLALKKKADKVRKLYKDELVIFIESFILVKGDMLSIENALDELFQLIDTPLTVMLKNKIMQSRNMQKPIHTALDEIAEEIDFKELGELSRIFASVELRGVQTLEQLGAYKTDLSNQSVMELLERIHKVGSKIDTPNALLAVSVLLFLLIPSLVDFMSAK